MLYRRMGRLGWKVSEIGYGMWGIGGGEGGWTGSNDTSGIESLQEAVNLGCNFFDTAWIYGRGHSEKLLSELIRRNSDKKLYIGTKIPPKDRKWPSTRESRLEDVFPNDHIREYTEKSLHNLGISSIDLMHFHVWEDAWTHDSSWQKAINELKSQRLIKSLGISINRWEPWNVIEALRTGLIDVIQVIYNIFDQAPEDELFRVCQEMDIGVIARVPFDEGTLTGTLTKDTKWPEGDWRNSYFVPENLKESVARAEELKKIVPQGWSLPELALRFILDNPTVSTVIPGMRRLEHVRANIAVSDGTRLPAELKAELRRYRWDREPTEWSQ
ncbi:aldo/keto reductase [Westiellopsis prolifica IICB1]|nr:aldo/keto reductase [Westiellopsis prolifica IICB1]